MIKILIVALSLLPGLALAVICKTVDADGVVGYTDVPAAECAQPIKLPDYSRYAPRPIQPQRPANAEATGSAVRVERYRSLGIVQPAAGATVRSNEGRVPVSLALQPALQQGHAIRLLLDGRAIGGSFDSLAIELAGIDRGTHSLQAGVIDASGRPLIESAAVRFTLRKIGLNDPANAPEPTPPVPPDYKPDYDNPSGGDYTPAPAPVPSTPGRTNPAFTPKYNP